MGVNDRNKFQFFENNIDYRAERMGSSCFPSSQPSEEIRSREIPPIVPCYNGKTLQIHEELVVNGLSAISIKHHKGNCKDEKRSSEGSAGSQKTQSKDEMVEKKESLRYKNFSKTGSEVPECLRDKMKIKCCLVCGNGCDQSAEGIKRYCGPRDYGTYKIHKFYNGQTKRRNSFWNIHKPELSKLTWPENFVSSAVLQDFFHNHLRIHGTFCEPLHEFSNRTTMIDEEFRNYSKLREIVPPRILPPDEKVTNIMEKSRSLQLNDEDLDPEIMVHKCRAEFCVTIGEYIRRPPLKRTTSQQITKCVIQHTAKFESLPLQHEALLSKDVMASEEKVSAVIGSSDIIFSGKIEKNSSKKLHFGNISGLILGSDSLAGSERVVATSQPSLNKVYQQYSEEMMESEGGSAPMKTILKPRDEPGDRSESRRRV